MEEIHRLTYVSPDDSKLKKAIINLIEVLSGRIRIQRLYEEFQRMEFDSSQSWTIALDKLNVRAKYDLKKLQAIDPSEPLIIIGNHPFGVIDGLIIGEIASKVRKNFAILVNSVLCGHDERLNDYLLPIDFEETKAAQITNLNTRKESIDRIANGEAIVIFPAGGVSTSEKAFGKATDLEWKRFVASLIQKSQATVLPIFFHGQNSRLFQIFSKIHLSLRLGLLLNEVKNKMGSTVNVTIGDPIPYNTLKSYKNRQDLIDYLREETYSLQQTIHK